MPIKSLSCLSLLLFSMSAFGSSFDAPLPEGIKNDQDEADRTISPQEALKKITVPEGFKVSLFAGEPDLSQPIAFTFDDRGRVWVVQNFSHPYFKKVGHDRVLIFEDKNGDGQFDEKKVFWSEGTYTTGIAYGHGGVWVCDSPRLQFIPDANGDDIPDGDPITILDGWNIKGKNNVFNNLNWGPDGWLYGCIGQNGESLVGPPGASEDERTFMSRGIWRYHPIKKKFEVVARGAVNPWGLDFDDYGEGFFTNCVLPHAWHLIPGAYYQRRSSETDFPDIYGRIPPIADHLHWAGGHWTSSRSGKGIKEDERGHSDFGGGHAHTGCMIYMGGNWPLDYRGTLLVGNIHGNRINKEHLWRKDSSYVASHGKDFLFGNHPWFRSLSQKYGHDGGVYVSDWHDYGECHDHDGTHRTSGRIYKVTYGKLVAPRINLQKNSNIELVKFQLHENEWYSRHSRRLLQERAASGQDMTVVKTALTKMMEEQDSVPKKLRALWCLHSIGALDESSSLELLTHEHESVRAWMVRFVTEDGDVSSTILSKLYELAQKDQAALVRLHLASSLQRLSPNQRAKCLMALAQRDEDLEDRMIPKMLYYASMSMVDEKLSEVNDILRVSKLPLLTEYLARLQATRQPDQLNQLLSHVNEMVLPLDSLKGIYESLIRQGNIDMPKSWSSSYQQLLKREDEALSLQATLLALLFKDPAASKGLTKLIKNDQASVEVRKTSLNALVKAQTKNMLPTLFYCLEQPDLKVQAIQSLATSQEDQVADKLLSGYTSFDREAREAFFTTMCSREKFALRLFEAIEKKQVSAEYLNSFHHRQMQIFKNEQLNQYLVKYWGEVKPSQKDKEKEIAKYKKMLSKRFISEADPKHGKQVFQRLCGACHKLFGEGGVIGPDLTGSGRKDLHYLLENIIDPSRIVSKNYQLATIVMKDDRIITGSIAEENNTTLTVSSLNEKIILKRDQIKSVERSKQSMMPEGMLNSLDRNQLRDLIGYLQQ